MGCAGSVASASNPSKKGTAVGLQKETSAPLAPSAPLVSSAPLAPASDAFVAMFGDSLRSRTGNVSTHAALAGKTAIGIYFSAHWCPPCRGFTPKLAEAYKNALAGKGMEIVFVSSDRCQADFDGYFKEMPWLALPFESRDVKEQLSKKFKVQGIPSFVILDAEANTITMDGRSKVMSDPKGANFPWKPRSFEEIIGDKFLKGNAIVGKEAIAGKTLGIYFSAHWCPPCRGFTPELARHYKAYKERGLPFEIIFSTGDRTEKDFKGYYEEMQEAGGDWLAIPWANSAQRGELDSLFSVSGIPCLVIVDENGQVVNKNARGAVGGDSTGDAFPWAPPAVGDLAQPEGLNETPSVCVLMEGLAPEEQKAICSQMEQVSERYVAAGKAKGDEPQFLFFSACTGSGPAPRIRSMCSIPSDSAPQASMILLDIGDNGGFYKSDATEITVATIEAFIKGYESKTIQRQQLAAPQ